MATPPDLDLIPPSENFYGADLGARTVMAAPASEFAGMVGDLLVTEEEDLARLWHVWWDGAAGAFQKRLIAEAGHWEHVTFAPAALPPLLPLPQARFLVIDGDSLGAGVAPNGFSAADVGAPDAAVGQRAPLPYFASHAGTPITLDTGVVGDEGWFALTAVPASWAAAGSTADGLRNYLLAGPGLGSPDGAGDPEALLGAVPGLTPLRAAGLWRLGGSRVCALVYQGDVGVRYGPLVGDLRGPTLGLVAFEVLAVTERAGALGGNLPELTIQILDAEAICGGRLSLDATTPAPVSATEPFDVEPPGVAPIREVVVTPVATPVPVGLSMPFRATAIRANGVREDVTGAVAWASTAPAVAAVGAAGVATGASVGTTTLRATAAGHTGAAVLTVTPPVVVGLAIAPGAAEIEVGATQAFAAIGTLSDGSTQTLTTGVTWTSGAPAVAPVSVTGVATSLAAGTTSLVATRTGVPPATATLVVRPRAPTIYGPLTTGAAAATGTGTGGASVQVVVNGAARGAAAVASAEGV